MSAKAYSFFCNGSVRCTYNGYCWIIEFVGDVVYHLVKLHDCDDSQNISGLYGGRMFWNVAPFRIVDEFDVFMDMELAAFEVVIPLYL